MRRFFKRLGWGLLILAIVLAAAAVWKREELTRLMAVNSLFAEDRIVRNFSGMDGLFLTRGMDGGTAIPLPQGPEAAMPDGFLSWAEARRVTATVVLHQGRIVHESYRLGTARRRPAHLVVGGEIGAVAAVGYVGRRWHDPRPERTGDPICTCASWIGL